MSASASDDSKFHYPDIWEDDGRMNVLYAPFRPKSINPIDWESKLKFWDNLIHRYCLHHNQPVFTLASLKKGFLRKGKVPASLGTVLEQLLQQKTVVLTSSYENYSLVPDSLLTWAGRCLVKNPVLWSLNIFTSTFSSKVEAEDVSYTHVPVVEELSERLYRELPPNKKGVLLNTKDLMTEKLIKDEATLKIIVRPLIKDGRAAVCIMPPILLIKFIKDDQLVAKVTEADKAIYQLQQKEARIEEHLHGLVVEQEAALQQVKVCLRSKRKQMAKTWLRRKKELDNYIENRSNALENVRCLLDRLKQAESDQLVLEAYRQGMAALSSTLKTSGLTEDSAEATMDDLGEVLDVHKDIEETLSRSLDSTEDSLLEDELNELVMENAPDVPPADNSSSGDLKVIFPELPRDENEKELEKRLEALNI